jgi:hypothetical protein
MSDHEAEQVIGPEMVQPEEAPDSLLESLRARRKEQVESNETFITLPGYDKRPPYLKAQYRLLEGKEVDIIARKVMAETKDSWQRQILTAVDAFIAACTGLYYDEDDGKGNQPMTYRGETIMGYGPDLAAALEIEGAETARACVFGVFADNDMAIMQHNVKLSLWMSDTTRKVDGDFLGEM